MSVAEFDSVELEVVGELVEGYVEQVAFVVVSVAEIVPLVSLV